MSAIDRSAWIEVGLPEIASNIAAVQEWVGPNTEVMAVVKANAYGHGLVPAARAAIRGGAAALGVALIEEGVELRTSGISNPIIVLGSILPDQSKSLLSANLSQTVSNLEVIEELSETALRMGTTARIHLKIDTGMGRMGISPDETESLLHDIERMPGLELEGITTHIAWELPEDLEKINNQIEYFNDCLRNLESTSLKPRWRHAANSVTAVQMPKAHFDLVRVGLLAYGIPPSDSNPPMNLKPSLALKARITQLRSVQPGQTVSYGGTFTVNEPSTLALVPLGYADGYSRALSKRAEVLIKGQRCPVVGAVCMDQFVVDVTQMTHPVLGDEVTLLGRDGRDEITVRELANWMDGISHEVVSGLSNRLPRVFME